MAVDEEGEGGAPPLLLISHGQHFEKQSLYSLRENRFHTTSIPLLSFMEIVGCGYGWVVLLDRFPFNDAQNCLLWNPISAESIPLPRLEHPYRYSHCILSHPPTQPDCYILLTGQRDFKLSYCKIGDEVFTTQDLDDGHCLLAIGVFQERIYGIYGVAWEKYNFVSIHFRNRNEGEGVELRYLFGVGNMDILSRPFHVVSRSDVYLVSCDDDELFLVRTSQFKKCCDFRVFRVDPNRMECWEVADIGGRSIFLAQHLEMGYCCKSSHTKPNCIYYSAGFVCGRSLYIYSLHDRSTTPMLPSPSVERTASMSFWVEEKLCRHFFSHSHS